MTNPETIQAKEARKVTDFESAKDFLFNRLVDGEKKLFGQERGVDRTHEWLEKLGDPQDDYPTIHIAGTSGKGSVSYMVSSILHAGGQKTGTILSPHVYDVRERMLVDLAHIDGSDFADRTQNVIPKIAEMERSEFGRPTYFETVFGMATKAFSDYGVDYGVVETGLGGRFDPTNTVKRSDKLAVITKLGLDHTHILGNTLPEIAWQKGGIIPLNGEAIALEPEDPAAKKVLEEIAELRGANIRFVSPAKYITDVKTSPSGILFTYNSPELVIEDIHVPLLGRYQAENAAVAITAAIALAERDGLDISEGVIRKAFETIFIPGRTEIDSRHKNPVIVDAAHNPQKMEAFFGAVKELDLPSKPLIIFGAKQTKDWQDFLDIASEHSGAAYFCEYFGGQTGHLGRFSVSSEEMADYAKSKGIKVGGKFRTPLAALNAALSDANDNQIIIVTGSMYMIGELHDQLNT